MAACCPLCPSPVRHHAPVAQRTRAPDYESGGPGFESWRRHFRRFRDVAQPEERPLWEREVRGSNPRVSTGGRKRDVAQPGQSARFGCERPAVRIRASRLMDRMEGWQSRPMRAGANREGVTHPRGFLPPLGLAPVAQARSERRKTELNGSQAAGCRGTERGGAPGREAGCPGLSDPRKGVRGFESRRGH